MIARLIHTPWVWLMIFSAYFIGLWHLSVPLTGDQKVYLSIALEMKERSSIVIPYLFSKANFLKPPFQYWMTLLGWKVFGLSILGAVLPSVLALLGSAYWVRRISGARTYLPSLFFAATFGTLTYGTTAQMEIWIVLFYLAAWGMFLEGKLTRALVVVGVMSWIKGPLYPVLWVASVFLYQGLQKDYLWFKRPRVWTSLFMGGLIGISWYLLAANTHREEMIEVFFGRENFGKIQTRQGSPQGLWGEFLFSLFPVILMIIYGAASSGFKERFSKRRNFFIAYGLIPALFFTFFPYRVNSYLYLLTPLAIWMTIPEESALSKRLQLGIGTVSLMIALILSCLALRLMGGQWIGIEIGIPLIFIFIIWSYSHFKAHLSGVALTSLLLVNLIRLGAVEIGEWDIAGLRQFATGHSRLAYLIDSNHEDIWHEFGWISAALETDVGRLKSENEIPEFVKQGGALILSDEQATPTSLQCENWVRIKRRMKFPVKELLLGGMSIDDSSLHRNYHLCYQSTI